MRRRSQVSRSTIEEICLVVYRFQRATIQFCVTRIDGDCRYELPHEPREDSDQPATVAVRFARDALSMNCRIQPEAPSQRIRYWDRGAVCQADVLLLECTELAAESSGATETRWLTAEEADLRIRSKSMRRCVGMARRWLRSAALQSAPARPR
jgi:hypothetical protein